jgi:hypothetical protein
MKHFDFPQKEIQINYNSLDYGPFTFDFEDQAPTGLTLSSVTLKSYFGRVTKTDDLSGKTETTTDLIDTGLTNVSGNYTVDAYFNYPGSSLEGNHTLIFELTWSGNSGTHAYYFYKVKAV